MRSPLRSSMACWSKGARAQILLHSVVRSKGTGEDAIGLVAEHLCKCALVPAGWSKGARAQILLVGARLEEAEVERFFR